MADIMLNTKNEIQIRFYGELKNFIKFEAFDSVSGNGCKLISIPQNTKHGRYLIKLCPNLNRNIRNSNHCWSLHSIDTRNVWNMNIFDIKLLLLRKQKRIMNHSSNVGYVAVFRRRLLLNKKGMISDIKHHRKHRSSFELPTETNVEEKYDGTEEGIEEDSISVGCGLLSMKKSNSSNKPKLSVGQMLENAETKLIAYEKEIDKYREIEIRFQALKLTVKPLLREKEFALIRARNVQCVNDGLAVQVSEMKDNIEMLENELEVAQVTIGEQEKKIRYFKKKSGRHSRKFSQSDKNEFEYIDV